MKRLLNTCLLCLLYATVMFAQQQTHTLTVKTLPQGLSSFTVAYVPPGSNSWNYLNNGNNTIVQIPAGCRTYVQVDAMYTGWKIVDWHVTQGNAVITSLTYENKRAEFVMPDEDMVLTLVLEYNPDNPDNPMPNAWYPDEGLLVADYVTGQYYSDILRKLVPEEDNVLVNTIIVGGYVKDYYAYVMDYLTSERYPSLRRVDMSRLENTDDMNVNDVRNRPWEQLLLPACVKSFGRNAFEGTYLSELTIYATTPPTLSYNLGSDGQRHQASLPSPAGLTVYVPEQSLPLYAAAFGWKEYDLQPIVEDAANLNVSVLPDGGDLSPYYGMVLEIVDLKSLFTRSMIIGNRQDYTFFTLPKKTSYDVRLLSRTGSVVAQAKNVLLGDDDANVKLTGLGHPCELNLTVSDGKATVARDLYSCLWLNADGRIIARGEKVGGILEDEPVQALVTLTDPVLKATYRERDTLSISRPGDYAKQGLTHKLRPIPTHRLTTVVERADGKFFSRETALLTINRSGSGELVRQLSFSSLLPSGGLSSGLQEPLPEGDYEVTVRVEDTNLSTVTQHLRLTADQTLTFSLSEANGSNVGLKWTHYGVAAEGDDANTAVSSRKSTIGAPITLRDVTNGRSLTGFAFNSAGDLRLQEKLEPGTEVELTLGSANNQQYAPVTMPAKADADGNLSYDITTRNYGTLNVSFTATECSRVSMRIYDGKGKLAATANAVTTTKAFTLLKDDNYTVVLMEGGTMADAMNTLADVEKFLRKNTDYVMREVKVRSGMTAAASFTTVPALRSDVHMYTDDTNTRISPKKAQLMAGTYQTLSTQVVFLPEFKGRISNLQAVFDLPDDAAMPLVEGSVVFDNAKATYTRNGSQLIVPITERRLLRFCVVPHEAGEKSISGKITFLLDGAKCEQPLSAASFTVKDADINVVDVSASKEVAVNGTSLPSVPVTIFVNDEETATLTSNIYGEWAARVPLSRTYSMAENSIYAKYTGSDGYQVKTPVRQVTYNVSAIFPLSVRMSHYNKWMHKEQALTFDLVNNTCTPGSYSFYTDAEFTFDVKLNTTDTTNIDRVLLYVYMQGDQRRLYFPKYNKQTGSWVATDVFNSKGLPTQVRVLVEEHAPKVLGDQAVGDLIHVLDNIYGDYNDEPVEINQMIADMENSEQGSAEKEAAIRTVMMHSGINPDEIIGVGETLPDTPEAKAQWETEVDAALANYEVAAAKYDKMAAEGFFDVNLTPFNQLGELINGVTFSTLSASSRQYYTARARGEKPAPLPAAGPNENEYVIDLEGGDHIYYRLHDNGYVLTIPTEDLEVTVDYSRMDAATAAPLRKMRAALQELRSLQNSPKKAADSGFADAVMSAVGKVYDAIASLQSHIDMLLKYMDYGINKGIDSSNEAIEGIQRATQENWSKYWNSNPKWRGAVTNPNSRFAQLQRKAGEALAKIDKLRASIGKLQKVAKVLGGLGKLLSVVSLINNASDFSDAANTCIRLYYSIPDPCKLEQAKADRLRSSLYAWGTGRLAQKALAIACDVSSICAAIGGLVSTPVSGGVGTGLGLGASLALSTANYLGNLGLDWAWEKYLKSMEKDINSLKCDTVPCEKALRFDKEKDLAANGASSAGGNNMCGDECQKGSGANGKCPGPPPPPPPGGTPIMDPSGYVFEAVGSNRVKDAIASVYYKEIYEDMYGDEYERTVLWDAAKFDQVNPMLTDENGEYGWDVPAGLWQVRVVKDGYLETYSDWLPVPPPQLDVNLAMQQPTAPVVQRVVATEQGLQLRFDKYMKPEMLTADNIFVTRNGQKLGGTLRLTDAEYTPDSLKTYARTVLFQPHSSAGETTGNLKVGEKVRLTVKAGVESYASVAMLNDFTQEFEVEQRVAELVTDSVVGIVHGEEYTLTVSALPADAAKGKKVKVVSLNPDIASISSTLNSSLFTLNSQGQAELSLKGVGYGTTAIQLTLADDEEVQTMVVTGVRDSEDLLTRRPTASRISGTEVPYGEVVRLRCETPGAVIYYTTDGSCPCDNPDRKLYTSQISIFKDITLKAIAIAPGYAESEVATFTYKVFRDPQGISNVVVVDENAPLYDLQGRKLSNSKMVKWSNGQMVKWFNGQMPKGVYIQRGKKIVIR